MQRTRWIGAVLVLALGPALALRGEGLVHQAVQFDADDDGAQEVYVLDPQGRPRLLAFVQGALTERTPEEGHATPFELKAVVVPAGPIEPIPLSPCGASLRDRATLADCLKASVVPKLGRLHPLSSTLFVAPSGNVGIGDLAPGDRLSVGGQIASLRGGFRFPDGTLQTTATPPGPAGPTGPQGGQGATGPPGVPGASGIQTLNGQSGPTLSIAGGGAAAVTASGSTVTVSAPTSLCVYRSKTYSANAICFTSGNAIGCSQGLKSLKLRCQPDGSWQVITSSQCFNPSAGPICGF